MKTPANEALDLLGLGKSYLKTARLRDTLRAFIHLQLSLTRIEGKEDAAIAEEIIETLARELDGFYRERNSPTGLWQRLKVWMKL